MYDLPFRNRLNSPDINVKRTVNNDRRPLGKKKRKKREGDYYRSGEKPSIIVFFLYMYK